MRRDGRRRSPASASGIGVIGAALLALVALIDQVVLTNDSPLRQALGLSEARGQSGGDGAPFDYYVLALSWSPAFCRENPGSSQCGQGRRFVLHGLWPNYESGYPEDCESVHRDPNRRLVGRYASLLDMPAGLLRHQWRRHGSCSGLEPEAYFETMRRAYEAVTVPQVLQSASRSADAPPRVFETAFLEANPGFTRDGVTIRCAGGERLTEVRICFTPDLEPRDCGSDVVRDCRAPQIELLAPAR